MVQDLFDAGKLAEINDYCRCDVLDTYFVFLRTRVLLGEIALADEQRLIAETKKWLESKADSVAAFRQYLNRWGDWHNPWKSAHDRTSPSVPPALPAIGVGFSLARHPQNRWPATPPARASP